MPLNSPLPAALLALALAGTSAARAASCSPKEPSIEFAFSQPKISRALSSKDLGAWPSNNQPKGTKTLGLYWAPPKAELNASMSFETDPSTGETLACLLSLAVSVRVNPDIFVASEIRPGGCADAHIIIHEMRHYDIDREQARLATAAFLSLNPLPKAPFRGASTQQAKALVDAYAKSYALRILESHENFAEPAQRRFHAEEAVYGHNWCRTEIAPLFR